MRVCLGTWYAVVVVVVVVVFGVVVVGVLVVVGVPHVQQPLLCIAAPHSMHACVSLWPVAVLRCCGVVAVLALARWWCPAS